MRCFRHGMYLKFEICFGFRISNLFRISDFGFRISDFGFHISGFLQQRHAFRGNGFFPPDRAHAFTGLALQADPLGLNLQDVGDPLADGLAIGQELGPLGKDNAIDVDNAKADRRHGIAGGNEHLGGVAAAVGRIGIGKHLADVAERGRPQEGVGDGVQ